MLRCITAAGSKLLVRQMSFAVNPLHHLTTKNRNSTVNRSKMLRLVRWWNNIRLPRYLNRPCLVSSSGGGVNICSAVGGRIWSRGTSTWRKWEWERGEGGWDTIEETGYDSNNHIVERAVQHNVCWHCNADQSWARWWRTRVYPN